MMKNCFFFITRWINFPLTLDVEFGRIEFDGVFNIPTIHDRVSNRNISDRYDCTIGLQWKYYELFYLMLNHRAMYETNKTEIFQMLEMPKSCRDQHSDISLTLKFVSLSWKRVKNFE